MARQISVEIIGDSRSLERAFDRSERSAKEFNRGMERAGRGAVVASVGFRGLGRAAGYASAQFLGGAGIVYAIKSTIDAAEESQRVIAQTRNALERTGLSWDRYGKQIEETTLAQSKMSGFDDERLKATFSLLVRRTGDVTKALELNALAADVARGANIELEQAAKVVQRASVGQARGLAVLGIQYDKTTTGAELLQRLEAKYAGSAGAYANTAAGAQDRFRVAVENLQEALGAQLLPTITDYLNKGADWLNQTDNQKLAVDTLKTSVDVLKPSLDALTTSLQNVATAAQQAGGALGFLNGLTGGLGGKLGKLLLTPGMLPITASRMIYGKLFGGGGGPSGLGKAAAAGVSAIETARRNEATAARVAVEQIAKQPKGVTATQRNAWFDAMIGRQLGRVQDVASLRGQIARLGQIAALIQQRLNITKDVTRRLTLEDQLLDVLRQQRQTKASLADAIKQRASDAAAAAKAARAAVAEQKRLATERQMGWLDFGIEKADATKSLADDRRALRAKEAFLKTLIRSEGRTLALVSELWRTRQKIRDLNKKHAETDSDPLAGLMQVSSKRLANMLAAGTGLGVAGRRTLGANIAGLEMRPVYVAVQVDGREIGRANTKDQARTARRTSRQTSGFRG